MNSDQFDSKVEKKLTRLTGVNEPRVVHTENYKGLKVEIEYSPTRTSYRPIIEEEDGILGDHWCSSSQQAIKVAHDEIDRQLKSE